MFSTQTQGNVKGANEGSRTNQENNDPKQQQLDTKDDQQSEKDEEKVKQVSELANTISDLVATCLDKIKPTLQFLKETLDRPDRDQRNGELDEQKLVDQAKPLIDQATNMLQECHGGIKGLDPQGFLAKRAQSNASERKATSDEYRLSDLLKELTENVTKTIDEAKRRIQDMPKAKKDLGPLLDLMLDPLYQILSAVALLLNGVLSLLGNLLGKLGFGGIVESVTGALGLNKALKSFGFGNIVGGRK